MADFYPAANGDDCHTYLTYLYDGNDLPLESPVYIRFPNVNIPNSSEITSAYLYLYATGGYSSSCSVKLYLNDIDNSVAPANYTDFANLVLTGSYIDWTDLISTDHGTELLSPAITSLIQGLVNRDGWASGNAIGIRIENVTGNRSVHSYNAGESSYYPKLVITYDTSIQVSVDGSFTVNAAMDAWKTPDELAEGFTVNASMKAGFETEGTLSEDLTVNAAMEASKETGASIFEDLTVNASTDAIATYNRGLAASASVADSIDALATYNRGLASTVNLGAVMDAEFKWPVKRQVFPYRAQGKRLSIRIGCAQKGSWIKLLDISTTVLPMVGRTRSQAVKLKGIGNHVGVKIGNTDGGTLKLAYAGLQIERPIGR